MKLYRGFKTNPKFLTPKLREELAVLEAKSKEAQARAGRDVLEYFRQMGDDVTRLYELRQITGSQFFTDDEIVAREFAGEKGFVVTLDVDEDIALERRQGDQIMAPAGKQRIATNYVFNGDELSDKAEDWKLSLIEIEREKIENEAVIKPSLEPSEGRPPIA